MPRDPVRIPEILMELERVWNAHPDWRFGQLIEVVFEISKYGGSSLPVTHRCLFNMEDDDALKFLEKA